MLKCEMKIGRLLGTFIGWLRLESKSRWQPLETTTQLSHRVRFQQEMRANVPHETCQHLITAILIFYSLSRFLISLSVVIPGPGAQFIIGYS